MSRYKSDNLFQIILELSKFRITIAVALTTIAGYILASRSYNTGFLLPTAGIFLLACGSSVINHLQEQRTDAIMSRTRLRPLPAGKVSINFAVSLALVEVLAGSLVLFFSAGFTALFLGLFALVWYNAVYTNLKKITPHAVIPGSLIGSIPPLVGWVSAGAYLFSMHALIIALFFFVWQVPHFYLLAIKYGKEYEKVGLPSVTKIYTLSGLKMNIFIWIIITALAAIVLSLVQVTASRISSAIIILSSLWLVFVFRTLVLNGQKEFNAINYFMKINYFVLAVIVMMVAGPLLKSLFHC
ncbi:MAG TPA: protoheme IX farnesyltransferase [Bacteroidales bacterium]|nr:protoheme IX farnesyltransferase [Bacteroidales bacterium]